MSTPEHVIIAGGGLAGAKTAEALREHGYRGELTLVAGENHLPYERPPMSKDYLAGRSTFEDATVHPADWYAANDVTLLTGTRVTDVEAAAHEVRLDDGRSLGYDKLVLATGSVPFAELRASVGTVHGSASACGRRLSGSTPSSSWPTDCP